MICSNCKKGKMVESFTTYYKKVNDKYFIVENVPCYICEECGEKTYSLKTLEKIEELILKIKKVDKANIVAYNEAA